MKKSSWIWIALFLGSTLIVLSSRILSHLNEEIQTSTDYSISIAFLAVQGIALFIVYRRPTNSVGWVLLAGSVAMVFTDFAIQYARFALITEPGSRPLGLAAAWVSLWSWLVMIFSFYIFLPMLFPTGRPISTTWETVLKLAFLVMGLVILAFGLAPGPIDDLEPVRNPLGLQALDSISGTIEIISTLTILLFVGLALISLAIRYRLSKAEERAQIRWFLFTVSFLFANTFRGITTDFFSLFPNLPQTVQDWIFATILILIALSIGIAILKYRLYEIDVIIRRTLIYGILTSILALVYFCSVLLMQSIIPSLTGQNSPGAIVLSTLFIAALFSPLQQRIQSWIDRRFYRRKFDAEMIIAAFSAALQDEVDPGQVTKRLISVVQETMQPEHVSIWLPGGGR